MLPQRQTPAPPPRGYLIWVLIYRWGQAELADLPPLETTYVTASDSPVQKSSHLGGKLKWNSWNSCRP